MQGLINKITKSIIAPLPGSYSGSFRGLIKSMLRKSPEHRPNAAELLRHPHLQPYVLQVNLKSSPAHNSLPVPHPASNHIKKIRFLDSGNLFVCKEKDKRRSLGNERILNHNQPATARQDSVSSTRSIEGYPDYRNQRTRDLSVRSQVGESSVTKAINRMPNVRNTPACTPCKTFTTPKKQLEPSEGIHTGLNRKLRPTSTPVDRLARPNRRASLPFPAFETPDRWNPSVLHRIESPDVSVNAPRIDWIAEFPLASSEDPLLSAGKAASVHGSSSATPRCVGRSLTKDKCTVHIFGAEGDSGSGSSSRNPVAAGHDASSRGSSDSRQRRFDTSSYRQRAEALEGLLEFSAQLLQQERFDELGVLLKPFGTEKASPRETAIWLTKSFKETTV